MRWLFSAVLQGAFRFAVFPKKLISFNPMQYVVWRGKKVKEHVYSRSYGKEDTVKETRKGCPSHDCHARRAGIQLIRQFGIRDDVIRLAQRHQHIRARLQKLRLVAEEHLHVRLL